MIISKFEKIAKICYNKVSNPNWIFWKNERGVQYGVSGNCSSFHPGIRGCRSWHHELDLLGYPGRHGAFLDSQLDFPADKETQTLQGLLQHLLCWADSDDCDILITSPHQMAAALAGDVRLHGMVESTIKLSTMSYFMIIITCKLKGFMIYIKQYATANVSHEWGGISWLWTCQKNLKHHLQKS